MSTHKHSSYSITHANNILSAFWTSSSTFSVKNLFIFRLLSWIVQSLVNCSSSGPDSHWLSGPDCTMAKIGGQSNHTLKQLSKLPALNECRMCVFAFMYKSVELFQNSTAHCYKAGYQNHHVAAAAAAKQPTFLCQGQPPGSAICLQTVSLCSTEFTVPSPCSATDPEASSAVPKPNSHFWASYIYLHEASQLQTIKTLWHGRESRTWDYLNACFWVRNSVLEILFIDKETSKTH